MAAAVPSAGRKVDVTGVTTLIRSVWGATNNDLWAVGNTGLILHYDGQTWSRSRYQKVPLTTGALYAAYGVANNQTSAMQAYGPTDTALNVDNTNIVPANGFLNGHTVDFCGLWANANEIRSLARVVRGRWHGDALGWNQLEDLSIGAPNFAYLWGVYINNSPRYYYIVGEQGYIARADATLTGFTPMTKTVATSASFLRSVGRAIKTSTRSARGHRVSLDGRDELQPGDCPNNDTGQTYYSAFYHPGSGRVYIAGTNGNLWYYTGAPWARSIRHRQRRFTGCGDVWLAGRCGSLGTTVPS